MNANRDSVKAYCRLAAMFVALSALAGAALAKPPREALITREVQDLYRAGTGAYYLRTIGCHEQVYGDRVVLRWNIGIKGGMMVFRNNKICVIDKVLREVDPDTMQPQVTPF